MTDGFHVPVIGGISSETKGSIVGIEFRQKGPIVEIKACTGLLIVIAMVTAGEHNPGVGVNVYITVPVPLGSMTDGDQVPGIGGVFSELLGSGSRGSP